MFDGTPDPPTTGARSEPLAQLGVVGEAPRAEDHAAAGGDRPARPAVVDHDPGDGAVGHHQVHHAVRAADLGAPLLGVGQELSDQLAAVAGPPVFGLRLDAPAPWCQVLLEVVVVREGLAVPGLPGCLHPDRPESGQAGHDLGPPVVVGGQQLVVVGQEPEMRRLGVVGARVAHSGHVGQRLGREGPRCRRPPSPSWRRCGPHPPSTPSSPRGPGPSRTRAPKRRPPVRRRRPTAPRPAADHHDVELLGCARSARRAATARSRDGVGAPPGQRPVPPAGPRHPQSPRSMAPADPQRARAGARLRSLGQSL